MRVNDNVRANSMSTTKPGDGPRALLGFRDGINGPHAARTMMLDDITKLLSCLPEDATKADYASAVIDFNCLGKPTKKARELAFRHLAGLYGLDQNLPLFRVFRRFWSHDVDARPVLALSVALARDPLLRMTQDFIVSRPPGCAVTREEVEQLLRAACPDRFSPASLEAFAQRINGTWTQAGFLTGKVDKRRAVPVVRYTNVAFSLFLGYLEGLSGDRLLSSRWVNLLCLTPDKVIDLATSASHHGLLVFLHAGGVTEVRFPGYLTEQEEQWRQEGSHV